jgi:hypothetical protein
MSMVILQLYNKTTIRPYNKIIIPDSCLPAYRQAGAGNDPPSLFELRMGKSSFAKTTDGQAKNTRFFTVFRMTSKNRRLSLRFNNPPPLKLRKDIRIFKFIVFTKIF